jgi:hypothetical protein
MSTSKASASACDATPGMSHVKQTTEKIARIGQSLRWAPAAMAFSWGNAARIG